MPLQAASIHPSQSLSTKVRFEVAPYEEILFDDLKLSRDFLSEQEHAKLVHDKLLCAADDLGRENGDMFAINQCLHLASTVVLRHASRLRPTLGKLRELLPEPDRQDPTTALTVATLYYLLRTELKRVSEQADPSDNEKLELLHKRLDRINWLVGRGIMEQLGIRSLSK